MICGTNNCGYTFPSGFDCCAPNVGDNTIVNVCPNSVLIGDGICDIENDNVVCQYDGGDCCPNMDLISNGQCDYINHNNICHFDGGDCCYERPASNHIIGNGQCTYFHNLGMCDFDGGDCCLESRIADGICDDTNNNRRCHFDGGDCCFGNRNTSRCYFCKCFEVFNVNNLVTLHNFSKTFCSNTYHLP